MSKTVTIILGVFLLLVATTIGFAWWWFNTQGRAYMEDAMSAYKEGEVAGARTNEQGCLDTAIATHRGSDGSMSSGLKNNLHFSGCLSKAAVVPTFCEGVPERGEIFASENWASAACKQHGLTGQYCMEMMHSVVEHCGSPERVKKRKPPQQ